MSKPVLKCITITYQVLAPMDSNVENMGLSDIHMACMDGDCSGHFIKTEVVELNEEDAIKACGEHGSDPEFFGIDA